MHEFRDVKLNHYANATDNYKDDKDVQSFISDIIKYIQKRFQNVNTESLSLYEIFDISKWPTDSQELSIFGLQELRKLLTIYSNLYFTDDEIYEILGQWSDFKVKCRHLRNQNVLDVISFYMIL